MTLEKILIRITRIKHIIKSDPKRAEKLLKDLSLEISEAIDDKTGHTGLRPPLQN